MTPRPTLPPARSTALWRSPSRTAADVHVEQPAVDPATAALPDRYGPSASFVLPSQLLQIELLRRPLEFALYSPVPAPSLIRTGAPACARRASKSMWVQCSTSF